MKQSHILIGIIMGLMITFGNELILCSDKGVMYSTNKGASWFRRR